MDPLMKVGEQVGEVLRIHTDPDKATDAYLDYLTNVLEAIK